MIRIIAFMLLIHLFLTPVYAQVDYKFEISPNLEQNAFDRGLNILNPGFWTDHLEGMSTFPTDTKLLYDRSMSSNLNQQKKISNLDHMPILNPTGNFSMLVSKPDPIVHYSMPIKKAP
jgi:hypothetical protein